MAKWPNWTVKSLRTKLFKKFGLQGDKFWPLRNLHMFLDIIEHKIENNFSLGKTVLQMGYQKSIRSTGFVPIIRQRLWTLSHFF